MYQGAKHLWAHRDNKNKSARDWQPPRQRNICGRTGAIKTRELGTGSHPGSETSVGTPPGQYKRERSGLAATPAAKHLWAHRDNNNESAPDWEPPRQRNICGRTGTIKTRALGTGCHTAAKHLSAHLDNKHESARDWEPPRQRNICGRTGTMKKRKRQQ